MADDDTLRGVLGQPFIEQVAAFRARLGNLVPTTRWDDIDRSAHDRAFMVAGALKADLLADLAGAVDSAISEGTGLETFRAQFRDIVEQRGWHGWTGEGTKRGEAWRTRVIYRTNASTTYASGRWAQLMEGEFPLLVYRHGGSAEPRPEHLAWDGLTLPPDHEFWASHAPPNGWGCSCFVVGARSEAGAARLGGKPDVTLPPNWNQADPRTGAPAGIDRGWNYAPGASAVDTILNLRDKLDFLPAQPSIDLIQDWLRRPAFGDWLQQPTGNWPLARLRDVELASINAASPVAELSATAARAQLRAQSDLSPDDYAAIQRIVSTTTGTPSADRRTLSYTMVQPDGDVLLVGITVESGVPRIVSFERQSQ
ncbi:MAG: phage minor head protein [Roseinatronobacter sp.]